LKDRHANELVDSTTFTEIRGAVSSQQQAFHHPSKRQTSTVAAQNQLIISRRLTHHRCRWASGHELEFSFQVDKWQLKGVFACLRRVSRNTAPAPNTVISYTE